MHARYVAREDYLDLPQFSHKEPLPPGGRSSATTHIQVRPIQIYLTSVHADIIPDKINAAIDTDVSYRVIGMGWFGILGDRTYFGPKTSKTYSSPSLRATFSDV